MSWRVAYWVIFAAMIGVYTVMVLWTLPEISKGAGGLMPFDLRPTGYTQPEAQAFLDQLNDDARRLYLGPQHWLDMVYPVLLGLVLAGGIWVLIRVRWLCFVLLGAVFVAVLADYYENYLVGQMLVGSGVVDGDLVTSAARATVTKSVLSGLAMLALLVVLLRDGFTKWGRR